MFKKIPGSVRKDYGECLGMFQGIFKMNQGNVQKDPGKCSRKFPGEGKGGGVSKCSKRLQGMLKKIPGILHLGLHRKTLLFKS